MKKKILIVDDIAENIQLAANILTNEGYQVEYATNGFEALEWIEFEEFDLILLDISMPGMDGFQVCTKVRENAKYSNLPIIFLSAITDKDSTIKGLKLGAQDFATKPYNSGELLSRIETHLELSDIRKKLQNMNILLEEQVKIRTAELETTMNELRIAKDNAEESSRLKSAFLANMSHEIRTPLNGIIGFSQIMSYPDISQEEKNECLESVNRSSKRLISLINNILDISLIDTGKIELTNKYFNYNDLLSEFYSIYKPIADIKNINLCLHLELSDDDANIESDEGRFHQIINNLMDNAIKFTKSGSIDFGYNIRESEIIFYVKDTGIGITQDCLPFIFDRFRQVEYDLSRSYDGAGIGLSLVQGLVELIKGGKIWVESEIDRGTAFYFSLPK